MNITIFKNIKSTSTGFVKNVNYALDRIKKGKNRSLVDEIRYEVNKDRRNELKQSLPSICFSGSFSTRSINGLKNHSGLICLDFDKFPDTETLAAARESLTGDQYVFALFTSPSGDGLKVLVKIPPSKDKHKSYFDALANYFDSPYFDKSTSDVSRVCYESYDPDLYHNPDSDLWVEGEEVELDGLGTESPILPISSENHIVRNLLKWWEKKYGKSKGSRNNNFFILAAAFNDFGVNKQEALNVLTPYEEVGFSEKEITGIVKSAYNKTATFGSRFFEDYSKKRNIEKEVINGKSIRDIKKLFPDVTDIEGVTEKLRETIVIDEFWKFNDKGNWQLVHHKFKQYLHQNHIFKFIPNKEGNSIFIRVKENKVSIITPDQIKDIVLKDLETRPMIGMIPFDEMAENTKYFKESYLSFIDTIEVELKKDTEEAGYLYYADKVIKVTQESIDLIDYIDLEGYVWENQIIQRTFKRIDSTESEYKRYVWLVSGQEEDRYNSIRSTIGYLLHSYKTRANNKCIILNDEVISENPNGGSGKGIYAQGISEIKKVSTIDGKQFNFEKSFPYQTVSADTQILAFDDVKKNFAFENLFSLITEGITIEKKNKDAIKVPVSESPKILITTNYTIGGIGGSFERRKFEVELSAHFGAHHSPLDEFGHMLFDDWNEAEWHRFDNFMIECYQFYLKNGLVKGEYKNLDTRKFIKDTSHEFYEWSNDGNIPFNVRINRPEKYDEFIKEYPDMKNQWKLSQKRFAMWIESYAEFKKLEYMSGKTNGERWALIKNDNMLINDAGIVVLEIRDDQITPF